MKYTHKQPAILLLEDGRVFYGNAAGKKGTATGEICYNTGMTGYQEVFTDPSYYGQIMVTTNAHIGNYGVHPADVESDKVQISALVCKNFNEGYSRAGASGSLQEYFEKENIVAICDIDTRALVRHIRDKGAMNAVVSSEVSDLNELKAILTKVPSMKGLELSSKVTAQEPYYFGDKNAKYKVAALDLGIKTNSPRSMAERGCYVKVFPMNTSFEEMTEWQPDAFFISNGPGDPAVMPETVETIKKILDHDYPFFGICLGHQMLALAMEVTTYKMHTGHRGINHPVKNLVTGKCEITSQNHGFVVSMEEAQKNKDIEVTHVHLNDGTVAGIRLKNKPAFSVQYHPESCPGPHDSRYLFDQFIETIEKSKRSNKNLKAETVK